MIRKLVLLVGVVLYLALANPIRAEQIRAPLVLLISQDGSSDLWAWVGPGQPLKQLTSDGYIDLPAMSPDGNFVAYDSLPYFAITLECSGWPPLNIWLLNLTSGNANVIADQPRDGAYCDHPTSFSFIRRPRPGWSPDSQSLAWGESEVSVKDSAGPIVYRLVTYNLARNSQRMIVPNLPGCQCITNGQQVYWGEGGIADTGEVDTQTSAGGLVVYDTNGKQLFTLPIDSAYCPGGTIVNQWVKNGTSSVLDLCDSANGTHQRLLDPLTQKQSDASGQLELYSPAAPDGLSLRVTFDDQGYALWHIAAKGQSVKDIARNLWDEYALDGLAISPDGQQIAYLDNKQLMVYDQSGQTTALDLPLKKDQEIRWLGWGPTDWRIFIQK